MVLWRAKTSPGLMVTNPILFARGLGMVPFLEAGVPCVTLDGLLVEDDVKTIGIFVPPPPPTPVQVALIVFGGSNHRSSVRSGARWRGPRYRPLPHPSLPSVPPVDGWRVSSL